MKRRVALLIAVALVMGFCGPAHAICCDLLDTVNVNKSLMPGEPVTYTHIITSDVEGTPFNPLTDDVISAALSIKFVDDGGLQFMDDWETADIYTDGVFMETRLLPDDILEMPWFGIEIEHFEVDFEYLEDGYLDMRVTSSSGDFLVCWSKLCIRYETHPVPEPATITLLGAGALLLLARRRFKR